MTVSFLDDTICRLTDCVLALSSTAPNVSPPDWCSASLCELHSKDAGFRQWLARQNTATEHLLAGCGSLRELPDNCTGVDHCIGTVQTQLWALVRQEPRPPATCDEIAIDAVGTISKSLVGWLLRDTSWAAARDFWGVESSFDENFACKERARIELRLWNSLHIAARIWGFENRFVTALDEAKREVVYHLAYGLSHEINNPLANISTRARVLAEQETDIRRRRMLEAIVDQAMRASEMIADLMLIARPPQFDFQTIDFEQIVSDVAHRAGSWAEIMGVEVSFTKSFPPAKVLADRQALVEALWCLVRNGIEAAASIHANRSIKQSKISEKGLVQLQCRIAEVATTNYIVIEVRDNGHGLSSDALKVCKYPYYCGREAGRSLGVGLSKAERIAQLHGGNLNIDNEPIGGCVATLSIPLVG